MDKETNRETTLSSCGKKINGQWTMLFDRTVYPEENLQSCLDVSEIDKVSKHFYGDDSRFKISSELMNAYCAHLTICKSCCQKLQNLPGIAEFKASYSEESPKDEVRALYIEEVRKFERCIRSRARML